MPPAAICVVPRLQTYETGSAAPATFTYTACRSAPSSGVSLTRVQPVGALKGLVLLLPTTEATITSPAFVPAGRASQTLERRFDEALDVDPVRVMRAVGSGIGSLGASWQAVVPESVNVLPASGMKFQS